MQKTDRRATTDRRTSKVEGRTNMHGENRASNRIGNDRRFEKIKPDPSPGHDLFVL